MDLKKVPSRSQGKETYRETSAVQMVTIFFFFLVQVLIGSYILLMVYCMTLIVWMVYNW